MNLSLKYLISFVIALALILLVFNLCRLKKQIEFYLSRYVNLRKNKRKNKHNE